MCFYVDQQLNPDISYRPVTSSIQGPSLSVSDLVWGCPFRALGERRPWCDFSQGGNDNFDWTLQQGPTPTRRTGPDRDYFTGTGAWLLAATRNLLHPFLLLPNKLGCWRFF